MSHFVRDSLVTDYEVAPRKIKVVGAGPNLSPLPCPLKRESLSPTDFLFVGKDFQRKGGEFLLGAFERLRAHFPDATLTVVGPPPGPSQPGVSWCDTLSHEDVGKEFQKAGAFVLPTLREPFGLAFLEAMAYELPCIGTRIEAVPEIISEGSSGLLVEPENCEQLYRAMSRLAASPQHSQRMGLEGRAKVEKTFNWDNVATSIVQGFEQFLSSRV